MMEAMGSWILPEAKKPCVSTPCRHGEKSQSSAAKLKDHAIVKGAAKLVADEVLK